MEVETKEVRFSVSGKFITNLAREWFYRNFKRYRFSYEKSNKTIHKSSAGVSL